MHSIYLYFWLPLLDDDIFHVESILQKRWAVSQSAIFCISYWLELSGILLMCLSVRFLIITSAPTITGTVVVLRCHIFSISISRFLYLLIYDYLLALTYQLEIMFFYIVLTLYIWFIAFYFIMSLDSKVFENCSFFDCCYWFWLVLIPFYLFYYILWLIYDLLALIVDVAKKGKL